MRDAQAPLSDPANRDRTNRFDAPVAPGEAPPPEDVGRRPTNSPLAREGAFDEE